MTIFERIQAYGHEVAWLAARRERQDDIYGDALHELAWAAHVEVRGGAGTSDTIAACVSFYIAKEADRAARAL